MNSVKGNCDEATRKSPKKMPFLSYEQTLKSYPLAGGAGTRQAISVMSETAARSVGTGGGGFTRGREGSEVRIPAAEHWGPTQLCADQLCGLG